MAAKKQLTAAQGMDAACILFELNSKREHIVNLDHLRSVIGFRGYAQRDPLNEYKSESFEMFQAMLSNLRQAVTAQLMRVELVREAADAPPPAAPQTSTRLPACSLQRVISIRQAVK